MDLGQYIVSLNIIYSVNRVVLIVNKLFSFQVKLKDIFDLKPILKKLTSIKFHKGS